MHCHQEPPLYGYLEIDPPLRQGDQLLEKQTHLWREGSNQSGEEEKNRLAQLEVTLFNQAIINEGRLHYIQSVSNQVRI